MDEDLNKTQTKGNDESPETSLFGVIMHSFFVIPFLIAVFCLLLFLGVHMLTREQASVYDYLEDVKIGGVTKRWQAAFELSKILANPQLMPKEDRFKAELISAFEQAYHDSDQRVRQYLALAMGRTGDTDFFDPLRANIKKEKEGNLYSIIYALGMLRDARAVEVISQYIDHPEGRIRSAVVVSLGNIADPRVKNLLKKTLTDTEPNVQWGSAISLAQLGDGSGKGILVQLMNRAYLSQFQEVDPQEQNHLIIAAIEASAKLNDPELNSIIQNLSQSDQNMKVRAAAKKAVSQQVSAFSQ